jgi:uncharacterized membrane protein YkvA (DUF1232 family)
MTPQTKKNKESLQRPKRRAASETRGRMKNFLLFLPNLVSLVGRLLKDSRVPSTEKALFGAALVYFFLPIDLIPDFFPFIGQVDDLYLISLTLMRLLNGTDASVVRQHWKGGGDIVALIQLIAGLAPKFLPRRIAKILVAKVDYNPTMKVASSLSGKKEPLIYEVRTDEDGA